jgi:hypothetical protein
VFLFWYPKDFNIANLKDIWINRAYNAEQKKLFLVPKTFWINASKKPAPAKN